MYVYIPNSVLLPTDSPVVRELPNFRNFGEFDKSNFDTHTIFFDVFVDRTSNRLQCIGPPLSNLRNEILPFAIYFEDKKLAYEIKQIHLTTFVITEPLPNDLPATVQFEFHFKSFKNIININWQIDEQKKSELDDYPLTLSTLQKDNPVQWVVDWVHWHCRLHDARRLVLYDNGSANKEELIKRLCELESEIQTILVEWSFPHGTPHTKYAQLGSLNHCRLKFPVINGFCINLDVDEYLVKQGGNLINYLDKTLKFPKPGAVILRQILVPNIINEQHENSPRCFNYLYRFKNIGHTWSAEKWHSFGMTKYIYRFQDIGYNDVHRTISEKNKEFSKRYSPIYQVNVMMKKCFHELIGKFFVRPRPRIDACHALESELFFFHFLGLNTKWKKRHLLTESVEYDATIHTYEPLILKLAESAALQDLNVVKK